MDVDFQSYKSVYQECDQKGTFSVMDKKIRHEDFDGSTLDLYEGTYTMVPGKITAKCLIKKFSEDEKKLTLYHLLRNIRHQSVLSVQNFYDESGQPRFVFSWADGTIQAWFQTGKAEKMMKLSMRGRCPSPKFRGYIIDICSGLEHLFKKNIYPIKIGAKDILMCKVGNEYFPKILIYEVKDPRTINIDNHKKQLWAEVRQTVKTLFNECGSRTVIDPISLRFFEYIGRSSVADLKNFPDTWSKLQKAKYLLRIMSIDMNDARAKVTGVGISWPTIPPRSLPSPLHEMNAHDKMRRSPSNYNCKNPYDFLRICKDIIKHWRVLPASVKVVCRSWDVMVDRMEEWNAKIWCILYEIFGSTTSL